MPRAWASMQPAAAAVCALTTCVLSALLLCAGRGAAMQAVIVARDADDCVFADSVEGLRAHALPRVTHIHAVVRSAGVDSCRERFHGGSFVTCWDERAVLNVTREDIKEWWVEMGGLWKQLRHRDPRRSGWFLQQLIKILVVNFKHMDLGGHFLVWDADMVLLREMEFMANTKFLLYEADNWKDYVADHYLASAAKLLNFKDDPTWPGQQCHLVNAAHMREMVLEIADGDASLRGRALARHIIMKLPKEPEELGGIGKKAWNKARDALSEYTLNAEWLLYKHPDDVEIVHKAFVRLRFSGMGFGSLTRCNAVSRMRECLAESPERLNESVPVENLHYIGIEALSNRRAKDGKDTLKMLLAQGCAPT
mmetsp:Transcript_1788/g.5087  ORF Transcript_1788/g.5087 Transcript_1788/m.5087 type:complete len:366 (-) Transcript_1788:801-1898(-)